MIRSDRDVEDLPLNGAQVDEGKVDVLGRTPEFAGRGTQEVTVNLEAGRYLLICNVPGHYQLEMRTAFTVD